MDRRCVLPLMWILCVCSAKEHHEARVKVEKEGITRFPFGNSAFVKFVSTSDGKIMWVGDETLYSIDLAGDFTPKQVDVNFCKDESNTDHSGCAYRISLLTESADGNLLFLCGFNDGNTKCCNMDSSHALINCFKVDNYETKINEPSLLVGDMLYFTLSEKGLYRINKDKNHNIWPSSSQTEQKYLKLITLKDKVYSFFTEKQKSKDGEPEQWIPRVSQSCMNDRGGPKGQLQSSWTSTIYGRLSCGRLDFTQLIDVATMEIDNETKIYTLFRNYWNMSAVCVYSMTDISTMFSSSEFNSPSAPASPRPGSCVPDSTRLSTEILTFMKERPEIKQTLTPQNGPLIFRHHHYTHIQTERMHNNTVLLLTLENGKVHKVLEESSEKPVFVIAEYQALNKNENSTKIISTMVDTSQKRLYVSSSNEVVQIDLQTCGVYGATCVDCVLSRDPYCGWNGSHCSPAQKGRVQYNCDTKAPAAAEVHHTQKLKTSSKTDDNIPAVYVAPSSTYVLICPVTSHHATYQWYHGNEHEECVNSDRGCLYFIESMNHTHEGSYRCVSSEDSYWRTVTQYQLSMSQSHASRLNPERLLLHVLLLLTTLHFL